MRLSCRADGAMVGGEAACGRDVAGGAKSSRRVLKAAVGRDGIRTSAPSASPAVKTNGSRRRVFAGGVSVNPM